MSELTVYQMVTAAVVDLGGRATYAQIIDYILRRWGNVNKRTIRAQTIALTVNHQSRGHYPQNQITHLTNSGSKFDILFGIGRGHVELYDSLKHGIWEVYETEIGRFRTRIADNFVQTIFTPGDIQWIKNVTNLLDGQAYIGIETNTFILHFPNQHKTNALSPKTNELIILWQTINGAASFTHLVTPVDDQLVEDQTRPDYQFGRRVRLVGITPFDQIIPIADTSWGQLSFSGISLGNACKLENIGNFKDLDDLRLELWEEFSDFFTSQNRISVETTRAVITELENANTGVTATEGGLSMITHYVKERNAAIVREKKAMALRDSIFHCEVCEFSFPDIFGVDYIECHHVLPIGEFGVRETRLSDLALVCANCHRMLHTRFEGKYLSIGELKLLKKPYHTR